ncbi:excalibur calcium-binding domain-containing protein [Aestuariivita boseongensis]|jgi:hypothetical protein|uniref:excalibur calcium-binding domain-containing protein n=1 Tax=Aestuariivita boseongensis TaxID=1470562 RepID=UPI0006835B97|nr:excalibur calcium-binding domain-containing protein [Aestuariivita boseongensis]
MRIAFTALALITLGACAQVPDSAAGVGFNNSLDDQRARQAVLAQQAPVSTPVPAGAISAESTQRAPVPLQVARPATTAVPAPAPVSTAQALPAAQLNQQDTIVEAAAALELRQANSGVEPLQASPSNPAPQIISNPGISDENDFQAVSARESIQSDAERIAQNRQQYQVVQPTAVPTRNGVSQPNIVQYALETRHPRGTQIYTRVGLNLAQRSARNCAQFASADLAQIEFLANGGPRRDRNALDPDGDGYACSWDPAPFRAAVQN